VRTRRPPTREEVHQLLDSFDQPRLQRRRRNNSYANRPGLDRGTTSCRPRSSCCAFLAVTRMDRLSSNAWKVVSYVAARQFSEDPAARNFRTRQRDYLPVAISLKEFCEGLRVKRRWKTRGTGLSKSSVADRHQRSRARRYPAAGAAQRSRRTDPEQPIHDRVASGTVRYPDRPCPMTVH
jgi:hypothetical protein